MVAFLWSVCVDAMHARYTDANATRSFNAAGDPAVLYPINAPAAADVSVDFPLGLMPREFEPNLPINVRVLLHSTEQDTEVEFTIKLCARGAGDAIALAFGTVVSLGVNALPAMAGTLQDIEAALTTSAEQHAAAIGDNLVLRLTLEGESRSGANSVWVTHVMVWQEIPA